MSYPKTKNTRWTTSWQLTVGLHTCPNHKFQLYKSPTSIRHQTCTASCSYTTFVAQEEPLLAAEWSGTSSILCRLQLSTCTNNSRFVCLLRHMNQNQKFNSP